MTPHKPFTLREILPKGVIKKHGALYWVSTDTETKKQKWHRLGKTWSESVKKYEQLVFLTRHSNYVGRHFYGAGEGPIPKKFLLEMMVNARKNAKAKQLECTLTIEQVIILAERTQGKCELSGIKFEYGEAAELKSATTRRKRVWAPSFDRIETSIGYIESNVRIVCFAVNSARQEYGDEVLMKVAFALSNTQGFKQKQKKSDPKNNDLLNQKMS